MSVSDGGLIPKQHYCPGCAQRTRRHCALRPKGKCDLWCCPRCRTIGTYDGKRVSQPNTAA